MNNVVKQLFILACILIVNSCAQTPNSSHPTAQVDVRKINKKTPYYKNMYEQGSYENFVARKDYPATYDVYKDTALMESGKNSPNKRIDVSIQEQRARLYIDDKVAMDFPVSTGVAKFPTKTGSYKVIEKSVKHESNLYGKAYDAEGNYKGENISDVPEGGRFTGSPMPFWHRLTGAGLGLHVGNVRRKPASHGCIRLTRDVGKTLYSQTSIGTPVSISHTPTPLMAEERPQPEKPEVEETDSKKNQSKNS